MLPCLLPFEEEASPHACLMSAACHSQAGFYSMKSPLHTHWALLSTLHFKNLASFRGYKDSGFFSPSIVMSICFPYRMHWRTLKTQLVFRTGVLRGWCHVICRVRTGAAQGILHNTGPWASPPGIPPLAHPALLHKWEWLRLQKGKE